MAIYAGLDVSDKMTHICVVDGKGAVLESSGDSILNSRAKITMMLSLKPRPRRPNRLKK